jgi:hypothetical protein
VDDPEQTVELVRPTVCIGQTSSHRFLEDTVATLDFCPQAGPMPAAMPSSASTASGSVANLVFACLYWGSRIDRLLENQGLNAAVMIENRAGKRLYFEFATEPIRDHQTGAQLGPDRHQRQEKAEEFASEDEAGETLETSAQAKRLRGYCEL